MPTSNYLKPQFLFCFILQNISFSLSENTSFGLCDLAERPPGLHGRRLRLGGTLAPRWGCRRASPPQGYYPFAIPVVLLRAVGGAPPPLPLIWFRGASFLLVLAEDRIEFWLTEASSAY